MMTELFKLSHRDFTANFTRSLVVVFSVGTLYSLALAILFLTNGLENTLKIYSSKADNGSIYLLSSYEGDDQSIMYRRAEKYHGEQVNPSDPKLQKAGILVDKSEVVFKFSSFEMAEAYFRCNGTREFDYTRSEYQVKELFSQQIQARQSLRWMKKQLITPVTVILTLVSMIILSFTMSHLLDRDSKIIFMYRSLGATKKQLFLIYFFYMLEICSFTIIFMATTATILSHLAGLFFQDPFYRWVIQYYPDQPSRHLSAFGVDSSCLLLTSSLLVSSILSFVLCLDQFSSKNRIPKGI